MRRQEDRHHLATRYNKLARKRGLPPQLSSSKFGLNCAFRSDPQSERGLPRIVHMARLSNSFSLHLLVRNRHREPIRSFSNNWIIGYQPSMDFSARRCREAWRGMRAGRRQQPVKPA